MTSIDLVPVAFKCPVCSRVVKSTRAFVFKKPLACPLCHKDIEVEKIQADIKKSLENFGKTVRALEGKS